MNLAGVVGALGRLAPLHLAEAWDNVGLLVEPTNPRPIRRVFLTNDLTEPVMVEAIGWRADFIVAYHPPIFTPLKRLSQADPKQRIAIQALEHGIAVYSPHTAADSAAGGVNDWLLSGLGDGLQTYPIIPRLEAPLCRVEVVVPNSADAPKIIQAALQGLGVADVHPSLCTPQPAGGEAVMFALTAGAPDVDRITDALRPLADRVEVIPLSARPSPTEGAGRHAVLPAPLPLSEVVRCVKRHLGLAHVCVGKPDPAANPTVRTVAVCAGAGADWLVTADADVVWTGELRHHDVLACLAAGKCVITCGHSNTERGWLRVLAAHLLAACPGLETKCSDVDADPLQIT